MTTYVRRTIFKISISNFFWFINPNPKMKSEKRNRLYYSTLDAGSLIIIF